MMVFEKFRTALWFAQRPSCYVQALQLGYRKFLPDRDAPTERAGATRWAAERAVSVAEALDNVGLEGSLSELDPALLAEGEERARKSAVAMGGPGDLSLLHAAVLLSGARLVVETGVAYGWSSLAILSAIEKQGGGKLISVDMPYPKMGNEAFVGIVVPDRLQEGWTLVRKPDRNGLKKALQLAGGKIDLAHYDSDKSYYGRNYAYPLIWNTLKPGGVFISDDIQDNFSFSEFIEGKRLPFAVTESNGKFVGIARKPYA